MNILTENINQIVSLKTEEKSSIEKASSTLEIPKGNFWVKQGKICDEVGFVVSGRLRNYYIDESENDITCYFVSPENFISSFTSFLTNTPANENISALEDTVLRVISKKDLEELSFRVPKIQIFRRVIAENLFITMEKRIAMLQSQSTYERYERMLKDNSDIILRAPLQYIASFLGITPSTSVV